LPDSADSDARFDAALRPSPSPAPSKRGAPVRPSAETVTSNDGQAIAQVTRKAKTVTLALPRTGNDGFEEWLAENLATIHRDWTTSRGD
jgi:hypothetical protein